MSAEKERVDAYLETLSRMEPDIAMTDASAFGTSIAISLKRIADKLSQFGPAPVTEASQPQPAPSPLDMVKVICDCAAGDSGFIDCPQSGLAGISPNRRCTIYLERSKLSANGQHDNKTA